MDRRTNKTLGQRAATAVRQRDPSHTLRGRAARLIDVMRTGVARRAVLGPWSRAVRRRVLLAVVVLCAAGVGGGGQRPATGHAAAALTLTGAGSTFIAPLMLGHWLPGYAPLHPEVSLTYAAVGSGGGIIRWTSGKADFAASDAPLTPAQAAAARTRCHGNSAGIPVTIGAVALIYNVPGLRGGVRLSPAVIAGIFLGTITTWQSPAIAALNPGVRLPDLPIQPLYRATASGTNFIFTSYLSAVSPRWRQGPGAGASVKWPLGTGVKGSAGMAVAVSTTLGAIGYVDLAYAVQDTLDYAQVQNAAGAFIRPSTTTASAAANAFAPTMPADLQQTIVDARAPTAYPITGYSSIFLCAGKDARAQALTSFVHYVTTTGQANASTLYYAPLPPAVQARVGAALDTLAR